MMMKASHSSRAIPRSASSHRGQRLPAPPARAWPQTGWLGGESPLAKPSEVAPPAPKPDTAEVLRVTDQVVEQLEAMMDISMNRSIDERAEALGLKVVDPSGTGLRVVDENDLGFRHMTVMSHFPTALSIDDFIARVEVVLSAYGFTGDNSIAMTNLCRDEVTTVLKDKIESVFGSSFNTNGLGAVLTCGVTGMGAGLSHSPTCAEGRERYVFFSFPHIAVDAKGEVGAISRPGRAGASCACGALKKCLGEFQKDGYMCHCKVPGVHDAMDPEYTILRQRLARRLRYERTDVTELDLSKITAVAERTITNDLEYLIEKAIDTKKADYAVVTGVQIHNWATSLEDGGAPSLEFAAPTKCYVVVNGEQIHLDLLKVPSLSPRMLMMLAGQANSDFVQGSPAMATSANSVLQEIPRAYLTNRVLGGGSSYSDKMEEPNGNLSMWPSWQSIVRTKESSSRELGAPTMDSLDDESDVPGASF